MFNEQGNTNEHLADHRDLPRLRLELKVTEQVYDGQPFWVVKDPIALRYFRFNREEYFVMEQLRRGVTLGDLKEVHRKEFQSDLLTITSGGREVVTVGPEPYQPTPGAVDMLALLDPPRDKKWGDWKLQDHTLIAWGDPGSIWMPYLLPKEYDIIVTVKRLAGAKCL